MRNTTLGLVTMLAIAAAPAALAAQMPGGFSVDVRGGVGVPTGDLGDDEEFGAETGFGFGATAQFEVLPAVAIYGGWSRFAFPIESELLPDVDADLVDSGFNGGVKLMLPSFMLGGLSPWIQGGAVYHNFELDGESEFGGVDGDGEIVENTLGYEVGGGLSFPLGQVISVTPGVRYISYSSDPDEVGEVNVSYVAADIGLMFRF